MAKSLIYVFGWTSAHPVDIVQVLKIWPLSLVWLRSALQGAARTFSRSSLRWPATMSLQCLYAKTAMRILDYSVWITANALFAVVVGLGAWKKHLGSLPIFFSSLGLSVCSTLFFAILFLLWDTFPRLAALYDWLAVAYSIAMLFLGIAVIYELWSKVVLSRSSLANLFRPLPRWSAAVIILLATIVTAMLPQSVPIRAWKVECTVVVASSVMEVSWLVVLLVVSRAVGVSWGILPAGVALGIVISDTGGAAGCLLLNAMKGRHGFYVDILEQSSDVLAGIVWVIGIVMQSRVPKAQIATPRLSEEALAASEHLVEMLDR